MTLLKILGYGYQYFFFEEGHYFFNALSKYDSEAINEIVFDSERLERKSIRNIQGEIISQAMQANPTASGHFYCMDLLSRIEIKPKSRKRIKLPFYNIINEHLLFSFPNVIQSKFDKHGIIILEKCMGNFGKCSIINDSVKFDDLGFQFIKLDCIGEFLVKDITLQNQLLIFRKDELICTSRRAYQI